ncbi:MAG: hypothetical protein LBH43_15795, partial [Treponema sp.]|nr:hypothetical protein [Treponema sp.]
MLGLGLRKSQPENKQKLDRLKWTYQNDWIFDPEAINHLIEDFGYSEKIAREILREWDNERFALEKSENKLEYFRKKILEHLSKLEKEEKTVNKALAFLDIMKGGFPVGTIRTWKGKKYIKKPDGKWGPKYDSHTRGAKMAISTIKKRILSAKSEYEMLQICLANRDRFSDRDGHPLPFMQELHNYIEDQKTAREKTTQPKPQKPKSNYSGGARESRLNRVKDDYKSGKIDFNTTVKEYMAIFPKLSKENAEKTVRGVFEQPASGGGIPKQGPRLGLRTKGKQENTAVLKERIKNKFEETAVPMEKYEFSEENFQKLFPNGKVKTPLGEVKLGEHQYQKLESKGRQEYLGAVFQTLSDPVIIIETERNEQKAKLYLKSFEDKNTQIVVSVVVDINGKPVSISTHRREMNNALNAIKKGNILYEKDIAPTVDTRAFNSPSSEERQPTTKVSPKSDEKSSDFSKIQSKYKSAKAIEGDGDEVQIGKETLSGKWKLVEADTPTASHDETSFYKTPGFPTNADGSSINDRDYEHFEANKEAVWKVASDFDGRALKFDNPVVVTTDGVVISGNNRTMSSKIAAKRGTDTKYIEALKKRAKKFG